MGKVKVINNSLDKNLVGEKFNSPINKTIFSLGKFEISTNFEGAEIGVNYGGHISGFTKPITLNSLKLNEKTSLILDQKKEQIDLNLDYSNLSSFVRFGSTREYLRYCIERIIMKYPAGIFMNHMKTRASNITYYGASYNPEENITSFKIPNNCVDNPFHLIVNKDNFNLLNGNDLSNINKKFNEFGLSILYDGTNDEYEIKNFIGDSTNKPYFNVEVTGNPFNGNESGSLDYHIKPLKKHYNIFKYQLVDFEKHILSHRDGVSGFVFKLKIPIELEDGNIIDSENTFEWTTSDGYNIDITGSSYRTFLQALLNAGTSYDSIKTDLIYNLLVPKSVLNYDLSDEKKISKLLRVYGKQIDDVRVFIDSLLYIHNLSYNKINNAPDALLSNIARSFGWSDLYIKTENDLVETVFNPGEIEGEEFSSENMNIELWRRILINTNYFWKAKGTRKSIISILSLLGLPDEFINFNEFIYTADGIINPNNVQLELDDFPTNTVSYDKLGFPKTPLEDSNFFFQISGRTDNGQRYMDVFRKVGFDIYPKVDNVKTVMPINNYVEERDIDNRLIINTKVVDINIDAAKAVEEDFYNYIVDIDYPANEEGYTLPAAYINLSLDITGDTQTVFELPEEYNEEISDLEVRLDGILLTNWESFNTLNDFNGVWGNLDFIIGIEDKKIKLRHDVEINEVLQITYIKIPLEDPEGDLAEIIVNLEVKYVVQRVLVDITGSIITLPEAPKGTIQLVLGSFENDNGIVLTEGSNQYTGDYMFITGNKIHIFNPDLISYFSNIPNIVVSYLTYTPNENIDLEALELRSESVVYHGINTGKIYKKLYTDPFDVTSERYVYKLNYRALEPKHVKFLVDGLSIKPYQEGDGPDEWDYIINEENKFELVINTNRLTLGSVLSAYYLVGGDALNIIIPGINPGDSFIEFLEKLQTEYIDVRTRKTITDYSSGWYPLLFKYYVDYIKRSELDPESPLLSNAYMFRHLFKFITKFGLTVSTFMGFVKQLLPATAVLRKDGVLVRNTIFTKQKFMHRRGVSFNEEISRYLGDDGSYFKKEYAIELSDWVPEFKLIHYDEETDSGYLGEIQEEDFITKEDLSNLFFKGDKEYGTLMESDPINWVFFYDKGKYLLIPKKPIRYGLSWKNIYDLGLVYGVDDFGPYNAGTPVNQYKTVKIENENSFLNGFNFIVRLIRSSNNNPVNLESITGGEWDGLFLRTCVEFNGDWDSFTSEQLSIHDIDFLVNGSVTWFQETAFDNEEKRIVSKDDSEIYTSKDFNSTENQLSWRPVLELIPNWYK